jgi:hypothetical protein
VKKIILSILMCSSLMVETQLLANGTIYSWGLGILTEDSSSKKESIYNNTQLNYLIHLNDGNFDFYTTLVTYISSNDNPYYNENLSNRDDDVVSNYVKNFYFLYGLEDKFSVGFGLISLTNNSFTESKNNGYKEGEGLTTIVHSNLGSFVALCDCSEDVTLKLGYGKPACFSKLGRINNYFSDHNKESNVYWQVIDYRPTKNNEIKIFNMYVEAKWLNHNISDTNMIGIGIKHDRTENDGFLFYDILGFSYYHNHSLKYYDEMMTFYTGFVPQLPEDTKYNMGFDNKESYGWSNLIGIRKAFDWNYETFIGAEWFHVSDEWFSLNNGNIYESNYNTMYNIRNDSIMFFGGTRIYDNLDLIYRYTWLNFDKKITTFNHARVTKDKDFTENRYDEMQIFEFGLKWSF